ncbi:MAG: radical SAM protein [Smithellaceae bacterium]|nr:radical SAM protein [Smithellaceae bacterium]
MILIYPPVVKPSEPPAGLAKLAGALRQAGVRFLLLDANLEGLYYLLEQPCPASDTWTKGAVRRRDKNLRFLKSRYSNESLPRYSRAVSDLNRILAAQGARGHARISLGDYEQQGLSPVKSADLLYGAIHPEKNPFYSYFAPRLTKLLEEENPTVVGLSINYLSQALCGFAMAGFLRKLSPKLRICMGGGLITSWLSSPIFSNPFAGLVDEMIAGPGEEALLRLCGREREPGAAPSYRELPLDDYLSPGHILPYSASSGCCWRRCAFCPEAAEESRYRPTPPVRVASDLSSLVSETAPSLIHLLDSALSPALLGALADQPLGVPWYGFARATTPLTDKDFCLELRRSGCTMLKLGIESGDQEVLDALSKGIALDDVARVLKNLKEAGIATYCYLLFGTPAETEDAARRTLKFTVRNSPLIDFLNVAVFNLPAWSPAAAKLRIRDFYPGDLALYRDFVHPHGWERAAVRHFLDREFKRNAAVAAILRRDPPTFTSNHAPFFVGA